MSSRMTGTGRSDKSAKGKGKAADVGPVVAADGTVRTLLSSIENIRITNAWWSETMDKKNTIKAKRAKPSAKQKEHMEAELRAAEGAFKSSLDDLWGTLVLLGIDVKTGRIPGTNQKWESCAIVGRLPAAKDRLSERELDLAEGAVEDLRKICASVSDAKMQTGLDQLAQAGLK